MEKMKLETANVAANNVESIGKLFPNCITESKDENGNLKRAINFELLRQMLSEDVVDGKEAYEFTWVGKKASIVEANKPIRKTLRPCKEDSVNWDTTENLYIEGDNLDVLKLLQESYLGKIKMIYIDPPYNTGNDIIYKNDYSIAQEEYDDEVSKDEEDNYYFVNSETNGRFHSAWLSMMYSRIKLARNLISEDGFFAIAIDHNEVFNLGVVCDEIFGFNNRIGVISVVHKPEGRNQAKYIGPSNEFMYIYIKDNSKAKIRQVAIDKEQISMFDMTDDKGSYKLKNFIRLADGKYATREAKPDFWYPIFVSKDLTSVSVEPMVEAISIYPVTDTGVERTWKTTKDTCQQRIKKGDIAAIRENGKILICEKMRENQVIKTHWIDKRYHGFHYGTKVLDDLLGVKSFDFPKSIYLMMDIFKLFTEKDDIIFDFFSGSATSAHAIMQLNAEDNNNRRFILAQIPATCDCKSPAYKSGYKTICEIGKERIRRAGQKILSENEGKEGIENLDVGFRVLKLDDTNMKDVYYAPQAYTQDLIAKLEENVKEDRTDLDLLFGCLLEWGLPLSLPYSSEVVDGCTIHNYNDGDLIACFDAKVPDAVIRHVAKLQPLRAVFRDSSFADSPSKINVGEIFKALAPDTRIKVI